MLLVRHVSRLVVSLVLVGCRGSNGAAEKATPPTPSATATGLADAATTGRADAGERGAAPTLSNLLYTTEAAVAVSSKVDNPKDFPEHLVNEKQETA